MGSKPESYNTADCNWGFLHAFVSSSSNSPVSISQQRKCARCRFQISFCYIIVGAKWCLSFLNELGAIKQELISPRTVCIFNYSFIALRHLAFKMHSPIYQIIQKVGHATHSSLIRKSDSRLTDLCNTFALRTALLVSMIKFLAKLSWDF